MGCISSKPAVSDVTRENIGSFSDKYLGSTPYYVHSRAKVGESDKKEGRVGGNGEREGYRKKSFEKGKVSRVRLSNLPNHLHGEQVAAGWPEWLSSVAGEAVQGWLPLKAEAFEKLEKIGQGTYSNVFRARHLHTRKIVALKKVRFDHFDPESVKFMSREIQILRKLNHPNVIKLQGLIVPQSSHNIFLVFEYMEHDLAGLLSCPDIKFTESQVKCYMRQLLSGLEHCHSHGIMHRDIKCSNLLVNNEGVLKIADFGLANFYNPAQGQPMTSRVVTLWYRPPELLLGSTYYTMAVDLWSVGCVFAELLIGTPILKGNTEVEQLHKIFKLCGLPPEDFWENCKSPYATIFKPKKRCRGTLADFCNKFPPSTLSLVMRFLSVEPHKRGTALSALSSEYFTTRPYACHSSSIPKYPPNKEINAKCRGESQKKHSARGGHRAGATRRPSRLCKPEQNKFRGFATHTEESTTNICGAEQKSKNLKFPSKDSRSRLTLDLHPKPDINKPPDKNQYTKQSSLSGSSRGSKLWEDGKSLQRNAFSPSNVFRPDKVYSEDQVNSLPKGSNIKKQAVLGQWVRTGGPTDSYIVSGVGDVPQKYYAKDEMTSKRSTLNYRDKGAEFDVFEPSPQKVDERLEKDERHIREARQHSCLRRESQHAK